MLREPEGEKVSFLLKSEYGLKLVCFITVNGTFLEDLQGDGPATVTYTSDHKCLNLVVLLLHQVWHFLECELGTFDVTTGPLAH